jgi:ferredoxin
MNQDSPGGADHGPGGAGRANGAEAGGGLRAAEAGGSLRAEVSLDRCTGTGRCVLVAPAAFRFTPDLVSEFNPQGAWTRAQLRAAADACPMSAITVIEDGPDRARPPVRGAP